MRLTTKSRAAELPESRRLPAGWSVATIVAALLLIFLLDNQTGSAPVQHLYYLPILFAAVRFRMAGGLVAALSAIGLYHAANPHLLTFRYGESDLVQVGLFIGVGLITAKLTGDTRRFRRLAMTDDLTGLHNLRSFEAELAVMVQASRESATPLSLLVLDVDRLKSLNDRYGHLTGAESVRTVGHIVGARVPRDAVACRYGGDEFVVALPGCSAARAREVADELRQAVHEAAPVLAGVSFPAGTLAISVGLASRAYNQAAAPSTEEASGQTLFRAADRALYAAKESGRNQVGVSADG